MQSENSRKHKRIKKSSNIVWLTAAMLVVLVIATVSVAGSCLYSYTHQSDCQISLYDGQVKESAGVLKSQKREAADPVRKSRAVKSTGSEAKAQSGQGGFEVADDTQVWQTETAIELFRAEYKNAEDKVTVKSADTEKVLAPGTEGNYTFSLKNTSNGMADYKVWVEAKLSDGMTGAPIETRMASDNGWLLGGENSWKQASDLDGVSTAATLGAGKTAEYTIYWQWPFEHGTDDTSDTALGDIAAAENQELTYTVTIHTLATTDTGSVDQNRKDQNPVNRLLQTVKTGDDTQILLWLAVLAAATGVVLCLLIAKKRKNDKENEQNESGQRS